MNQLFIILAIAQSGLATAKNLVSARAKQQAAAAEKETNATKKAKLEEDAKRSGNLAKALGAADAGITSYLAEA